MALPDNVIISSAMSANFIGGRARAITDVLDYETGGTDIGDASDGMQVQVWKGELIEDEFGDCDIILSSDLTAPVVVYSGAGITEFSFTFDQNMRPVIAFVQADVAKLYWYDSSVADYVVTNIAVGAVTPKVSLDDKRASQNDTSDVIVGYVADGLYFQMQRDRYEISYFLTNVCGKLMKIGMTNILRFMFDIKTEPYSVVNLPPDGAYGVSDCLTFDGNDPYDVDDL